MTALAPAHHFSKAAHEVLEPITVLLQTLAATTRDPAEVAVVHDLVACRLVELLEIYIRRVLETIYEHDPSVWAAKENQKISLREALELPQAELIARAREEDAKQIAERFEVAQKVLGKYLREDPFTAAELEQFIKLKEHRNLLVHNNGIVDRAFAARHPTSKVGERVDTSILIFYTALAVLTMVQRIDQKLLERYPDLGTENTDFADIVTGRFSTAVQRMAITHDEGAKFNDIATQLKAVDTVFPLGTLLAGNTVAGLGTLWQVEKAQGVVYARAIDNRIVAGFTDEQEAVEWLMMEHFPPDGLEITELDEEFVHAQHQHLELRWPVNLWPQEK